MNKKIMLVLFFAAILIVAVLIFAICFAVYIKRQEYNIEESFKAGEQELDNPARGFYKQLGTENPHLLFEIKKENLRLVLAAFDIIAYKDCSIPEEKLQELDTFLMELDKLGLQAIFRAAYGFNKTECNDADSMDRIEEHILQIAPILNKHKNVIYCVQAGFLGPWGEWHSSTFLEGTAKEQTENRNRVLKLLLEHLDDSIVINVRRPRFIRDAELADLDVGRIGYHNDGLLASKDDLGTYDDKNYNRAAELAWLKKRSIGINGGEMPMISQYTEIDTAVQEFCSIHISYLNAGYNTEVLSDWKKKSMGEENDAYEYIKKHLGYRLYVPKIRYRETWRTGRLKIWIENKGFSAISNRYQAELILKNENSAVKIKLNSKKIHKLNYGMQTAFQVEIPKEFLKHSFQIGFKLYDKLDERNIVELANQDNDYKNGVNYIFEVIHEI